MPNLYGVGAYGGRLAWIRGFRRYADLVTVEIEWLSTDEAAAMVGVTPRTLYRLIDSGQVPAYRMGRLIRLQRSEVETFIEESRIEPGSLGTIVPTASASSSSKCDGNSTCKIREAVESIGK